MFNGLRPTLTFLARDPFTGKNTIKIEASPVFGGSVTKVELTEKEWENVRNPSLLIQEALPLRSASFRELFLTGMSDKQFAEACGPEEE